MEQAPPPPRGEYRPPVLKQLYWAFATDTRRSAGTRSQPVLILGNDQQDLLHHTAELPDGIEDGSSHLVHIDLETRPLQPYFQYMRMGLRGSDAWSPNKVFVFGEMEGSEDSSVSPIALLYKGGRFLSTDPSEGYLSVPLNRASLGGQYTRFNRILMLIQNGEANNAGTSSPIFLTIEGKNQETLLEYRFPDDRLRGPRTVFFEIVHLEQTLQSRFIHAIHLQVGDDDSWTPGAVFIMALDDRPDQYEEVVPLVYIPDWSSTGLGTLSEDANEGPNKVTLYRAFL